MAGAAGQLAKENYKTETFRLFQESLIYVCDFEERVYNRLNEMEQMSLDKEILAVVKKIEEEFKMSGARHLDDADFDKQQNFRTDSIQSNQNFRISFIQQRETIASDSGPFFTILHLLRIVLSDLCAGTMMMHDVLSLTRHPEFKEFVTFLQVMEVYGSGYHEDVDY